MDERGPGTRSPSQGSVKSRRQRSFQQEQTGEDAAVELPGLRDSAPASIDRDGGPGLEANKAVELLPWSRANLYGDLWIVGHPA